MATTETGRSMRLALILSFVAPCLVLFSGCAVTGAAVTGVSLGAKAASTTVGVAGSAVKATGSAAGAVVGGDDDN